MDKIQKIKFLKANKIPMDRKVRSQILTTMNTTLTKLNKSNTTEVKVICKLISIRFKII